MTVGSKNSAQFRAVFGEVIPFKATVDLTSVADQTEEAIDITVTGAVLGDFVVVSAEVDLADLVVGAYVSAADTVTLTFINNTTGAVDLASTVYSGVVLQRGNIFEGL